MKLAKHFHKAYTFIVSALITALAFIQQVFEIVDPEFFGEVGVLGYGAVGALLMFLRALPQKDVE